MIDAPKIARTDDGGIPRGAAIIALQELTHLLREQCPWDQAQSAATIVPHTLEEAYEVADVARRVEAQLVATGGDAGAADLADFEDELGDLLFQVCFLTMWCGELDPAITLDSVAAAIHSKLVRRHPHVFGDISGVSTADGVRETWEQVKRDTEQRALFEGIPNAMPAVGRARKLQSRAAGVGFDFASAHVALDKLDEEVAELRAELERAEHDGDVVSAGESLPPDARIESELGDVLFAAVNVARLARVDPELALGDSAGRFRARVEGAMQLAEADGTDWSQLDLAAQESWYQRAKASLAAGGNV